MIASKLLSWYKGLLIEDNFDWKEEIECAMCAWRYRFKRCGKTWVPVDDFEIRFFAKTHGYLCWRCFCKAEKCKKCDELAVVKPMGLCRNCFIEEATIGDITDAAWRQTINIFEQTPVSVSSLRRYGAEEEKNDR